MMTPHHLPSYLLPLVPGDAMQWQGDNQKMETQLQKPFQLAVGWHTLTTDHWSLILLSQGTPGTGPHLVSSLISGQGSQDGG